MSYKNIIVEDIKIDSISQLPSGHGTMARLMINGCKVEFQTPALPLAWAAKIKKLSNGTACSLGMQLGGSASKEFEDFLLRVHKHVAKLITDDSEALYDKKLSMANTLDYLSPLIKDPPKGTSYAPTFAAKINLEDKDKNGELKITVPVFDIDRSIADPDECLFKDTIAVGVVTMPYVHIAKATKLFTIRCDVQRVLIVEKAKPKNQFSFDMNDEVIVSALKKRKIEDTNSEDGHGDGDKTVSPDFDEEALKNDM